ncbi:hypothetical protein BC936DRAFT_139918 [Jimgerdemannia flammicorona]|uniref:Uncharacterized protein n=1 Tax=Jimgerdemannia flammicorona TaxID=994334 RepID=A0A433B921_9FUNG|nr:hypothetical protein BC936DRAFT_139918 [Jimgerdemannia flammicorona]
MHPFRTASSLSPPLFHFDSSIHHRAERVVRQQNLDPNHHAIPMPILDTRVRPTCSCFISMCNDDTLMTALTESDRQWQNGG